MNKTISIILIISLLEKRAQPQQIIQPPAVNQIAELKGSPPAKKIVPRRLINASPLPQDKTPLKGKSRMLLIQHKHILRF
jgi:hypothetical protein